MEAIKEKLNTVELEAIRLTISGKSDVQAYKMTHPRASKRAAASNAYKFFQKARAKLSENERMELYNLNTDRVLKSLDDLLQAKQKIIYKGKITGEIADNFTRLKATEMLLKIHGLFNLKESENQNQEQEPLKIIFDWGADRQSMENDPNVIIGSGEPTGE